MELIKLSPSKLNDFRNCPRCFWDAINRGVQKPRGAFPSLPGGMDRVAKAYVDNYRGKLPPQLVGQIPGVLFADLVKLNRWRNWRTGMVYEDHANAIRLSGAVDDIYQDVTGAVGPLDWKTKGSEPKDDGSQYYQTQLDCYTLLLMENGYSITGYGYLTYLYPLEIEAGVAGITAVRFAMKTYRLTCDPARATAVMLKAAACIRGDRPAADPGCEVCAFTEARAAIKE